MSDIEYEEMTDVSNERSLAESDSESDYGVVNLGAAGIVPYQDEPIILPDDIAEEESDEEEDIDGIPLERLEARFQKRFPLNEW